MEEHEDTAMHPAEVTLLDYVVGALDQPASREVRGHVAACAECRERIVALSMALDELDRLPSARIPHDALDERGGAARRRGLILPIALLVGAALGIAALFGLGGLTGPAPTPVGGRIVLETANDRPEDVISEMLGGLPHSVTVDRDDPRHLVVLVRAGDVAVAGERLSGTSSPDGRAYVVDIAGGAGAP